jgi:hypothetical protein
MTYVKPSIANLGTASSAIQGHANKGGMATDADESQQPRPSTGSSYDLDE